MKAIFLLLALLLSFSLSPLLRAGTADKEPIPLVTARTSPFEVSIEEATLKEFDGNVHSDVIQSSLVTFGWEPWQPFIVLGEPIRFQLCATAVVDDIFHGEESFYIGFAPQFRLIAPLGKTPFSLFLGGGAGCGYANTLNVSDSGHGDPFTFIIMGSGGIRYTINQHWAAWLGVDYQRLSNAGLSDWHKQNINLDSIGAIVGVGYKF